MELSQIKHAHTVMRMYSHVATYLGHVLHVLGVVGVEVAERRVVLAASRLHLLPVLLHAVSHLLQLFVITTHTAQLSE